MYNFGTYGVTASDDGYEITHSSVDSPFLLPFSLL